MKGKANVVCPKCKHCEGLDRLTKMYSCKHYNNYPDSAIGMDCEIECDNFEAVNMNKVEGKVGDFCLKCKNCKAVTRMHDGKNASIRITEVDCEDPYDGMVKTLDVDSDICCSMFEPIMANAIISEEEYNELKKDHDSWRERYYEVRYALRKDEQLNESISCVRDIPSDVEVIEDLKKRAAESDYYKEMSELLEERNDNQFDTIREKDKKIDTLLNTNKGLTDKIRKLTNKIVNQQSTHYKQCARILELENMVSKLQSGEYDDILAKDIEIKSLQNKYEAAMTGWKDAIDTNDKMIGEKDKQIEELTRRYNMIAKKLNDIHDILKEDPNNE